MNVVAHRLFIGSRLTGRRSACPHCHRQLSWYELIPVISWLALKGHCRTCHQRISFYYPLIEVVTALVMTALWYHGPYFIAYAYFFSALMVTVRTDLEHGYILYHVSRYLIPFGLLFSYLGMIPLSFTQSVYGTLFGYLVPMTIAWVYKTVAKKDGLGQGDVELLAAIGSFTGITGVWLSLVIGSWVGLIAVLIYALIARPSVTQLRSIPIAFGPFLALGAILYVLYGPVVERIFLGF